jgi:hypothetical protein
MLNVVAVGIYIVWGAGLVLSVGSAIAVVAMREFHALDETVQVELVRIAGTLLRAPLVMMVVVARSISSGELERADWRVRRPLVDSRRHRAWRTGVRRERRGFRCVRSARRSRPGKTVRIRCRAGGHRTVVSQTWRRGAVADHETLLDEQPASAGE